MSNILDRIAGERSAIRPVLTLFRPASLQELFALRLSQKLGDSKAVRHYAELATTYREETLLLAYRKTLRHPQLGDRAHRFHVELKNIGERSSSSHAVRLAAIKVERRAIAVAVFIGTHLDYTQVRQLSSQPIKAEQSALSFINWIIGSFGIESATLEHLSAGSESYRTTLNDSIVAMLRENMIPFWEIPRRELLTGYGQPPIKSRTELRRIAKSVFWQMGDDANANPQTLDAATLGLHVQTERLFIIN